MGLDDLPWMPRKLAVLVLSLILLGLAATADPELPQNPSQGDIVLAGLVLTPGENPNDGLPEGIDVLPGALVIIEGTEHKTSTDSRGLFIFTKAPDGEVTLVISKAGYQTVKLKATVDTNAVDDPPTLRVEMLKVGASASTGPGTLYAALCPRVESSPGDDGDFTNLLAILALGVDPLTVAVDRPPTATVGPEMSEMFPTTEAPCSIMIRPPDSPSRTTYLEMGSVPVWPCFDKTGRFLYVSTVYQHRIEIFDVTRNNEYVANVPLQNAFISSLTLSRDGRYIYGTQMARQMGVLCIDTKTLKPTAFLELPDAFWIPNALAQSPDGGRLYLTLTSAVNAGAPGQLVTLDPSTGALLSTTTVGGTPTDVLITPDGKTAITVNMGNGNLSVVDLATGSVVRTIQAEVSPTKAVLTRDGRIFVANKGSNTVSVLNLADGRTLARIKVGKGPVDIVLSPDESEAYVSNYQDGTISLIDVKGGVVKTTTPPNLRSNPLGLAIRPRSE